MPLLLWLPAVKKKKRLHLHPHPLSKHLLLLQPLLPLLLTLLLLLPLLPQLLTLPWLLLPLLPALPSNRSSTILKAAFGRFFYGLLVLAIDGGCMSALWPRMPRWICRITAEASRSPHPASPP
ncbi:hypothetical protein [Polaromonas jejuensis]|uniref:Uncharacterized protein n=1 Tax=Polaromonas jejuensis TaxID=457502 RepID=A0ABW0Q427_9BURK|nr:hypothetical protein [Polaromonas jejuensis]